MIDPNLLIMTLFGVFIIVGVASKFTAGLRRRALISLVIAVFMTPTIVVGHGIGITLASLVVVFPSREGYWEPGEVLSAFWPMALTGIFSLVVGSIWAWRFRSRAASRPAASVEARRRERLIVISSYAASTLLVFASWSYRAYARDFKATYGPFVVTVDTGPRVLQDIVTYFSCQSYPPYSERVVLESGKPHEFPPKYMPGLGKALDCSVIVVHPDLELNIRAEFPRTAVAPRTPITFPTVHAPPWSDARYQRILRGEELTPGGEGVTPLRRAEIAIYDDWIQLSTMWTPAFCVSDMPRIQQQYLPSLAARRDPLFLAQGMPVPQEDPAGIVLAGWKSSCDFHAAQPPSRQKDETR